MYCNFILEKYKVYAKFLLPFNEVSLLNSVLYSGMIAAHSILMFSF